MIPVFFLFLFTVLASAPYLLEFKDVIEGSEDSPKLRQYKRTFISCKSHFNEYLKEVKVKGNFIDAEMVSFKECLISLSDLYSAFSISSDIEKRELLFMAYNLLGQQLLSKLSGRLPKDFITLLIYEHYQLLIWYRHAKQIATPLDYYENLFGTIFKHWNSDFYEAIFNLLVAEHFSKLSKDEAIKIIFKDINIPSIAGIPLDKAILNYSALCDSIHNSVLRSIKTILSEKPKATEELDNEPKFKKFMEELPNFRTAFKKEIEKNHWFTEKSADTGETDAGNDNTRTIVIVSSVLAVLVLCAVAVLVLFMRSKGKQNIHL